MADIYYYQSLFIVFAVSEHGKLKQWLRYNINSDWSNSASKGQTLGLLKSTFISTASITGFLEQNIKNQLPPKSHIHSIISSELLYIFWHTQLQEQAKCSQAASGHLRESKNTLILIAYSGFSSHAPCFLHVPLTLSFQQPLLLSFLVIFSLISSFEFSLSCNLHSL